MFRSALIAGISGPAIVFGLVVPVVIFLTIVLLFKLIVHLIRSIRDKRLEREYLAEKKARSQAERDK